MRSIFFIWLLIFCTFAYADVPGKPTNNPSNITLQNVAALSDYTIYWSKHYDDTTIVISKDTTISIPGSAGAPDGAICWGIHKKTGQSTDTLSFSNHYNPDNVVVITGITGGKIQYSLQELSNANKVVTTTDKDSIADKKLVKAAEAVEKKHTGRATLLAVFAAVGLAGITGLLLYRRKQKAAAKAAQGTGS